VPAGDLVKEDDVLLQIETDKVTIDVRYTEAEPGTLIEYLCKEDDTVAVGQEVVKVDKGQHDHITSICCHLQQGCISLNLLTAI
jgi:pyruvate/2-oxoglutarate dehydrogenase complex dihydrolipoamide acyltransferase (E2) component